MDYLPIFLDIRGRRVLVDGGDTIAARRVERALGAGAQVVAFDPEPGQEMLDLSGQTGLTIHDRLPRQSDIRGCAVVYGASEDRARDEQLYNWSRASNVLCNIADWTEKCDFITPSIVDRSPIVIAISTGGAAPVIARILRARIESIVPSAFGQLAAFTGAFRNRIATAISTGRDRRRFWERMIDGPAGDLFLAGNTERANKQITDDLDQYAAGTPRKSGEVYLVGAGPGDPDLLTFRALRLMQRCDVVLYDRLVGDDIMSLVRRDAQRVYVGKLPQDHTMQQEDISDLMVRLAKEGNRVLRLKGGDPFIFGRGGEEIEKLAENGIGFQIVPGITAAAGCGSYAGIPLTHRDHAQACSFVTAHGKDGALALEWDKLIQPGQTLAVYMGLSNLQTLVSGARDLGVDMSTPVAVIQNGTRADQVVLTTSLSDVADKVAKAGMQSPAMILIGSVVTLREKLNWTGNLGGGQAMALSSSTTPAVMAKHPSTRP